MTTRLPKLYNHQHLFGQEPQTHQFPAQLKRRHVPNTDKAEPFPQSTVWSSWSPTSALGISAVRFF